MICDDLLLFYLFITLLPCLIKLEVYFPVISDVIYGAKVWDVIKSKVGVVKGIHFLQIDVWKDVHFHESFNLPYF